MANIHLWSLKPPYIRTLAFQCDDNDNVNKNLFVVGKRLHSITLNHWVERLQASILNTLWNLYLTSLPSRLDTLQCHAK